MESDLTLYLTFELMKYLQIVCVIDYFVLNLNCFSQKTYENTTLLAHNSHLCNNPRRHSYIMRCAKCVR